MKCAELLKYIRDNNITSVDEFKNHVDYLDEKHKAVQKVENELREEVELEEKIVENGDRFIELKAKGSFMPDDIAELRAMNYMFRKNLECHADIERHCEKLGELKPELAAAEENTKSAKAVRDRAGAMYRTYLEQMEGDFGQIRRMIEQENAERQRKERERIEREQRIYEDHYRSSYRSRGSSWER